MATIKFRARGQNPQREIYIRLSAGRSVNLEIKTGYTINAKLWRFDKITKGTNKGKLAEFGMPKQTDAIGKQLKEQLDSLSTEINKRYNQATEKGTKINSTWLQAQIEELQNRTSSEEQDKSDLLTYLQYYIEYLPSHIKKNGQRGLSKNTIQKFNNLKNRFADFQKAKRNRFNLADITPDLIAQFDKYLRKNGYSDNYIGTLTKDIKTLGKHARKEGFKVSNQLDYITAVKAETYKVILTLDELEKIKNTTFERDALDNARDWLLIGCFIGQRVSDLLRLTADNVVSKGGLLMLELTQQKTGNKVILPLQDQVQEILQKRSGQFPRKISDQKFNTYIKELCKQAEIKTPTKGTIKQEVKINGKKTFRNVSGVFPKHELITSHICRRSFATNYYGDIPTPLLMSATGHTTENKFLIYIGKSATDQAHQLAEYWAKLSAMNKKETNLKVVKKAQ
ncbi:phage integrase SAM-like domain-containing protein [Carboxylicivirga sp. RSCT41]|uniref:site-specific integrase n=1 Tax=Carboxylicivirga agarovorans TaxID=3417570 RepID=UPI003D33CEDD